MKKTLAMLTISLSLLTVTIRTDATSTQQCPYNFTEKIGIGASLGCVIALGGYGLYKLGQWFFEKTDSEIYVKAHTTYKTTEACYHDFFQIWNQEIYYADNEFFLERLWNPIHTYSCSIDNFLITLMGSIETLNTEKYLMVNRIKKLDSTKNPDVTTVFMMKKLVENITSLKKNLRLIYKYLNKHKSYFKLHAIFNELDAKYQQESVILADYEKKLFKEHSLNKRLATCILLQKNIPSYPYITYVDQLTEDLQSLDNALKDFDHSYQNLSAQVSQLVRNITTLKTIIVTHDAYHKELLELRRNKLEQKRIDIEKKHIALEKFRIWNSYFFNTTLAQIHCGGSWYPYYPLYIF